MSFFKNKRMKSAWNVFRPLIIVLAFYLIFKNIKIESLRDGLTQIKWWTVLLFLFFGFNSLFLHGFRWWILIRAFTKKLSFVESMAIHFSSAFYSLILPNSTAQEVVRTVYATKTTGYVISWSSAWICKIMGVSVLFVASILGLLILPDHLLPPVVYKIVFSLFLLMCVAFFLSFTKKISRRVRKVVFHYFPNVSLSWFEKLREGIYRFRDKKGTLIFALVLTILTQIFSLAGVSLLLYGITGKPYFIEVIAFIPLIEIVSMAQPFTPNGIGVREALTAVMFRYLDLPSEQLAIYVVISNLSILLKLFGAIPVIHGSIKKKNLIKILPNKIESSV